jgi:hypothetical protein
MIPPLVPSQVDPKHPVVLKDYGLFTPAAAEMADVVFVWLYNRIKGAIIYGPSQFGKTHALLYWLRKLLSERMGGPVPMVIWSHQDGGASSPGMLHGKLLAAAGQGPVGQRRGNTIANQLVERLVQIACLSSDRYVVLVIDEAQSMSEREWRWLVQLHATLEIEKVQLCIISVAAFQFNDRPRTLALTGSAHVSARFMLHDWPFRGIRTPEELKFVLQGYDEDSEWPEGSGISYTAGLARQAFAEGFRVQNYTHEVWTALNTLLPANYSGPIEFPMQSIAVGARQVLLKTGAAGSAWEQCTSFDAWKQAVADTGHTRLMSLVFTPGRSSKNAQISH